MPWKAAAIAHGGVGSPPAWSDGCRAAVDDALKVVEAGGDPVDAAVAGVVVMEDDPREGGASAEQAAQRAVDLVRGRGDIGIIVISPQELAAAADRPMAWAARESGSGAWRGP